VPPYDEKCMNACFLEKSIVKITEKILVEARLRLFSNVFAGIKNFMQTNFMQQRRDRV